MVDDTGPMITEEKQIISYFKKHFKTLLNQPTQVCPILKKGNPTQTENYRRILLVNTCYKILMSLILEKINSFIKEIVGSYQFGFRKENPQLTISLD